ncbi:MAG: TAXI family TRAP transporter solute-binding subunit [Oscillospiraceae bacterium]
MKGKTLVVLLLALSFMLSIAGCGGAPKASAPAASAPAASAPAEKPAEAPSDKPAEPEQPEQPEEPYMDFPKDVKVGTSPGAMQAVIEGLCSLMKDEMNVTATPYGGSGATDRMVVLGDKQIELTALSNDTIFNAFYGTGVFEETGSIPVRLLGGLQVAPIHLATWSGSGVKGVEDLVGKTFMCDFVTAPFVAAVGQRLLEFHGIADKVTVLPFSTSTDAMNALREHTADMVLNPGSIAGSSYWMEVAIQEDITFFSMTEEERNYIAEKEPYLFPSVTVPAGVYKGLDEDCVTIGFMNSLIALEDTNYDFVYEVMKTLFDDVDLTTPGRFTAYHADTGAFTITTALLPAGNAPFHAAAVQYYKDRGFWTDELEAIQQELLAKAGATR